MLRPILLLIVVSCAGWSASGQSTESKTKFEMADVHSVGKGFNQYSRTVTTHKGRYEWKSASMVDLVRTAYGVEADKVIGGPRWMEMNKYDITAKVPEGISAEAVKPMLQALLEERFNLKAHKETKPMPIYALVVGKKPLMKEADGSEEAGCKPQAASGAPSTGGTVLTMMNSSSGTSTRINLGPGMVITYNCRNMTMAAFVDGLHSMLGNNLGTTPVTDKTGLAGRWNFDVKWSMSLISSAGAVGGGDERVSIFDALEKQLGLKLEEQQVPTSVVVVDSVNEQPSANPPEVAKALPPIPLPTEFEVASVKLADPSAALGGISVAIQPSGRFVVHGAPMSILIQLAFVNPNGGRTTLPTGIPGSVSSTRIDIDAKVSQEYLAYGPVDVEARGPLMLSLLKDRFGLKYHTEDQPQTAYNLVAAKPKMKQADPANRTNCKSASGQTGQPAGTTVFTCRNISMGEFADYLAYMGAGLSGPVSDASGLDGRFDLTLTFTRSVQMARPAGGGGEVGQPGSDLPAPSDPTGGYTIFEALEKQLGLKLETVKRPQPAIVIDHIDEKPTEN